MIFVLTCMRTCQWRATLIQKPYMSRKINAAQPEIELFLFHTILLHIQTQDLIFKTLHKNQKESLHMPQTQIWCLHSCLQCHVYESLSLNMHQPHISPCTHSHLTIKGCGLLNKRKCRYLTWWFGDAL